MRLKRKKYVTLFFMALILLLASGSRVLNSALSESVRREGDRTLSNMADQVEIFGEMLKGDILKQQLYLEEGALAVGVRIGTYIRQNDAVYVLTVYDGDGNIIGRNEASAETMPDNQMCQIPIYARISKEQDYYLTIESLDAVRGNAVTCYGVKVAEGHKGAIWNGEETGMELVTEVIYQKIFPITEYAIAILAVFFLFYLFYKEIKDAFYFLVKGLWGMIKPKRRGLLLGCILFALAGISLLLIFPTKSYGVVKGYLPEEDGAYAQPYTGKWVQEFTVGERFDAIEVKLGTYMVSYQKGSLKLALYDIGTGNHIAEGEVDAKQVRDNHFLQFQIGGGGGTYRLEMWAEDFEGQPLALYYTKDGGSLIFHLLRMQRERAVLAIFSLTLLAIVAISCYFCLFSKVRKERKRLIVTALLSILVGILLNTYWNYRKISLEAVAKNLGLFGRGEEFVFSKEQIEAGTVRSARYSAQGSIYSISDAIYLRDIFGQVDSVTLYFEKEGNLPKKNNVSAHLDMGDGFPVKAEINYEYAFDGQEKICVPITESGKVKTLLLGEGRGEDTGGLNLDDRWYALEKIVLNESPLRLQVFNWSFLVGFLFVWLAHVWQHLGVEACLKNLEKRKNVEVRAFVVASLVYGIMMSFLIPVAMTPDEQTHIWYTFKSIGTESVCRELFSYMNGAVAGIGKNAGVRVDWGTYCENLGSHLSQYPTSFKLHIEILNYPGAALGSMLGLFLHLPVGGILFIGEVISLLLYTVVGAFAIWVTPIKKKLFALILLLPIAIQQAASFSYDSFNCALSLLVIAYFLRLGLKEEKVKIKDMLRLALMLFLLLYIKKVYVLLGFLVFLVPYKKIPVINRLARAANSRWKKITVVAGGSVFITFGMWFGLKVLPKIIGIEGVVQSTLSILNYPKELLAILGRTITEQMLPWRQLCFGWFDTITAKWTEWVVILTLIVAALFTNEQDGKYSLKGKRNYFICLGIFSVTFIAIIFALRSWVQSLRPVAGGLKNQLLLFEIIEGVQGRYFIPIIALLFLFPVSEKIERALKQFPTRLYLLGGWFSIFIFSLVTLLGRYWI